MHDVHRWSRPPTIAERLRVMPMRVLLAAVLLSVPLARAAVSAQSGGASDRAAAEPPRLEFDVASLKRHVGDAPVPCLSPTGATVALTSRTLPSGQITITGTCAR